MGISWYGQILWDFFFSIRVQLIMRCVTLPVTQNNSNGTKKSVKSSRLDDSMGNNYAGKLLRYQQNLSNFSVSKYSYTSKYDEKIPVNYKIHEERTLQSCKHQRINLLTFLLMSCTVTCGHVIILYCSILYTDRVIIMNSKYFVKVK